MNLEETVEAVPIDLAQVDPSQAVVRPIAYTGRKVGGVSNIPARPKEERPAPSDGALPTAGNNDFVYNGGPLIVCPQIFVTYWGSSWNDAAHITRQNRLNQYYIDLLNSNFMNMMSQYGNGMGARNGGAYVRSNVMTGVTGEVTGTTIQNTIQSMINSGALPEPGPTTNNVLMIHLDETTRVNDTALSVRMCEPTNDNAFGFHYFMTTSAGHLFYYAVIPSLDNTCITNTCGSGGCSLSLSQTQEQRITQVASHELAEMLSDPDFPKGWFGPTSDENGDICNGQSDNIVVGKNTWMVQKIYSRYDDLHGGTRCNSNPLAAEPMLPGPAIGHSLRHKYWNGSAWGGPENLGGVLNSPPAVASWGANRLDIFVVGTDQALWHRWWNGSAWGGWESLGGFLTSKPSVVAWGPNRLDVFARGGDKALWHKYWNGSAWSAWESLGGILESEPVAVSWGANRIDVFVIGADQAMWHKAWNGSAWIGWESRGGQLNSSPCVSAWGPNRLDVFVMGMDRALYHQAWNGSVWSAWEYRGGTLVSPPAVASWGANRLDVFVEGADQALWHQAWTGTAWSNWQSLGGVINSTPGVTAWGPNRLDVFALGADRGLWHRGWNGSAWAGWEGLGGTLSSLPVPVSWGANRLDIFAAG